MNIAITGSSGFIGKHLKKMITEMNLSVITISNNKNLSNFENNFSYEDFFSGSINTKIDFILHLASPNYDYSNDGSLKKGITELTQKIITRMDIYDCKKIIYFSSAKVYGEPALHEKSFNELSDLNPMTDYGKEKANAEHIMQLCSESKDISYLIYRMPMVYGPNMKSNIGSIVKIINESLPMVSSAGTDNLKKSFLSIENIKTCIKYNLEHPESVNNNIYNLSDNDVYSFDEFIMHYKILSNSKSYILRIPNFAFNIISVIPYINKYLIKLYGSFIIKNDKINGIKGIKLINTIKGLTMLIKHKKMIE